MREKIIFALSPFIGMYKGFGSMMDEKGRISMKRGISLLFAITIMYMIYCYMDRLMELVPVENQNTLRFIIVVLCCMILLLFGIATFKDIIALRTGVKESVQVQTPQQTVTAITETPAPPQNTAE